MSERIIEAEAAKSLGQKEKWDLLSPFLRQHGHEALAYATLQSGLEYFITPAGDALIARLTQMCEWSKAYFTEVERSRDHYDANNSGWV